MLYNFVSEIKQLITKKPSLNAKILEWSIAVDDNKNINTSCQKHVYSMEVRSRFS